MAGIELHHTITFGVLHVVGKHGSTIGLLGGMAQQCVEVVTVVDIVTKDQCRRRIADEFAADDESLRQTIRRRLYRIAQLQPPLAAIAEQIAETRRILRRRDQQNFRDTSQHQHRQRMVDHGLVINRQQLLGHAHGDRIQTGARTTGKNNAFAARSGRTHG